MESANVLLPFLSGLVLRLGLPIAATVIVIYLLRKMDNRWKTEAEKTLRTPEINASTKPCWEVMHCSPEERKSCAAIQHPSTPCWQFFRTDQGILKEKCLGCDVFRLAPLSIGD